MEKLMEDVWTESHGLIMCEKKFKCGDVTRNYHGAKVRVEIENDEVVLVADDQGSQAPFFHKTPKSQEIGMEFD
jgi:hypothetical protein